MGERSKRPGVVANLGELAPFVGDAFRGALKDRPSSVEVVGTDELPSEPAEVLATLHTSPEVIERLLTPEVRWVHVLGTGVDGFPFDLLGDRVLTCSRGASAIAISEFVLASMLAFEKHLPATWINSPPPRWGASTLGGLSGRTLGLVGLGAIGTAVAQRASAFGTQVIGIRRRAAPPPEGVDLVADLPALLGASDHVVLAAPATPSTRHLLDSAAFGAMRRGAHLVNIARGSLIDQDALVAALDDGTVALASLDVTDPEPLPDGHVLYSHPRVHLSAHVSWGDANTARLTVQMFADDFARYCDGLALQGVVDVAAGY